MGAKRSIGFHTWCRFWVEISPYPNFWGLFPWISLGVEPTWTNSGDIHYSGDISYDISPLSLVHLLYCSKSRWWYFTIFMIFIHAPTILPWFSHHFSMIFPRFFQLRLAELSIETTVDEEGWTWLGRSSNKRWAAKIWLDHVKPC